MISGKKQPTHLLFRGLGVTSDYFYIFVRDLDIAVTLRRVLVGDFDSVEYECPNIVTQPVSMQFALCGKIEIDWS